MAMGLRTGTRLLGGCERRDRHGVAVSVRRCVFETTANELVIRVCPVAGLGCDGASLVHPVKGVDPMTGKGEEWRNRGEASRAGRGGKACECRVMVLPEY